MYRHAKTLLKAILVLALVLVTRYALARGFISEVGIHRLVSQAGILAGPGFILIFAVGLVIFAPPLLLIGSGTLAFGSALGAVYSLVGLMVGGGAAFLLGRYVATDFARNRKQGRLKKIDEWIEHNGLAFMVSLRLTLFANPALNYAASLTAINLKDFVLGSFIGLLPGVFVISYLVDELMHATSFLGMLVQPAMVSMWLLRLAGIVLFIILTKRYGKERLPEQGYVSGD
jgi:uncharacterized membrane protein YdjX (TVP38/TMEM64 family)